MIKNRVIKIEEPKLTFGYKQKAVDPRDGLMLFGPFTRDLVSYASIGIIGTPKGRERFKNWFSKIQKPVYSEDNDIARPFFPGLEASYNISVNFKAIQEIDVDPSTIENYLRYVDGHLRVHNLVNLFIEKLIKFKKEEEQSVLMWFVIIPDAVYTYGRPMSRIPKSDENIRMGLGKKKNVKKYMRNVLLFEEDRRLEGAYKYEINFHNQLKAKLLEYGIITQIIKESTIAYEELFSSEILIQQQRKFDSAKAWSLSTALYYKVGGLPWKLDSVRENVCYIGLVYKKMDDAFVDERNACCAAQMFLDSGDGMVFKGNVGPWYNPDNKEYHLNENAACELIEKALLTYENKNKTCPKELFIHAKTYFNDEEWAGFTKAAKNKSNVVGVRIRDDNTFKLYREYSYPVLRGTVIVTDDRKAFLWTKGFVSRLQTVFGLETPNPLSIEITKGYADLITVCRDILSLTKLNYNTCIYGDGIPVTLRFADAIGEILTAGPLKETEVLTFKHYI